VADYDASDLNGFIPPAGTPPTIIEGIAFINSAMPLDAPFSVTQPIGPQGAIQLRVSGPVNEQSVIRNCRFRNFMTPFNRDQTATVDFKPSVSCWRLEGNTFDGVSSIAFMETGSFMTFTGNTCTRWAVVPDMLTGCATAVPHIVVSVSRSKPGQGGDCFCSMVERGGQWRGQFRDSGGNPKP
jgi:hypothetical protein